MKGAPRTDPLAHRMRELLLRSPRRVAHEADATEARRFKDAAAIAAKYVRGENCGGQQHAAVAVLERWL